MIADNLRDAKNVDLPAFVGVCPAVPRDISLFACVFILYPYILVPYIRGLKHHYCNSRYILRDYIYILLINIYNIRLLPVPHVVPHVVPQVFFLRDNYCLAMVITQGTDPLNRRFFVP